MLISINLWTTKKKKIVKEKKFKMILDLLNFYCDF